MAGWDEGYVSDVGYTMGYYGEMNPLHMRMALIGAGWEAPQVVNACELGYGQGLSINLHAAASPVAWWGTDFAPAQASFARGLGRATGADVHLFDDSFAEFTNRPDMPEFDFIALHGIWSWVSEKNRSLIVDFIRRKLKVGGVAYVSYNVQPGWSTFAPMRDLMALHGALLGAPGQGSLRRASSALEFAERLLALDPMYARANPVVQKRIEDLRTKPAEYIAHEYLNRDWHPMLLSAIADCLEPAKLQFACSARPLDHIDGLHLTEAQQQLLDELPAGGMRETVRDFMVNQQFRADYWIKGGRRLSARERAMQLGAMRIVLTDSPSKVLEGKVRGTLGEGALKAEVYGPVLDALADHLPHTYAAVVDHAVQRGVTASAAEQAVWVLMGCARIWPVADEGVIEQARVHAAQLNAHVLARREADAGLPYLASPVLGGGYAVNEFAQWLMLAMRESGKGGRPEDLARKVSAQMESRGRRPVKNGQELSGSAQGLEALTQLTQEFVLHELPILQKLGIAA